MTRRESPERARAFCFSRSPLPRVAHECACVCASERRVTRGFSFVLQVGHFPFTHVEFIDSENADDVHDS